MILERNWCTKCKTTDNLLVYNTSTNAAGDKVIYKMCRDCNAERHREWYKKNPKKAQMYNRRYRTRNFMDL